MTFSNIRLNMCILRVVSSSASLQVILFCFSVSLQRMIVIKFCFCFQHRSKCTTSPKHRNATSRSIPTNATNNTCTGAHQYGQWTNGIPDCTRSAANLCFANAWPHATPDANMSAHAPNCKYNHAQRSDPASAAGTHESTAGYTRNTEFAAAATGPATPSPTTTAAAPESTATTDAATTNTNKCDITAVGCTGEYQQRCPVDVASSPKYSGILFCR